MFLPDIATFCVWPVKVLMRLYICADLSESPSQQPSGPRDVCFCLTLLLSVCDQWRYWWDCTFVQACLNLHCSNPVGQEMCILSDIATFCVWVTSESIDETVHKCRSEPPLLDYHVIISQSFCSCSLLFLNWFEPWHEISNNLVCATSKGSDQPVHMRSLIRAFTCSSNILWVLSYWLNTVWGF